MIPRIAKTIVQPDFFFGRAIIGDEYSSLFKIGTEPLESAVFLDSQEGAPLISRDSVFSGKLL